MSSKNNKRSELTILRNHKYNIAAMEGLGMKWYKFNIYFRLFAGIIRLLSDIASVPMNYADLWGVSWNISVYLCFAIALDTILIVGTILTRHWLAHFNKKGVQYYFIIQYLSQVVVFVAILLLLGFDEDTFSQNLGELIAYGIFFALEYKYWKKRIHLFDNFNQGTYAYSDDSNEQTENPNQVKFCRKCGFELVNDSEFCSQCGTKILANTEMNQNDVL